MKTAPKRLISVSAAVMALGLGIAGVLGDASSQALSASTLSAAPSAVANAAGAGSASALGVLESPQLVRRDASLQASRSMDRVSLVAARANLVTSAGLAAAQAAGTAAASSQQAVAGQQALAAQSARTSAVSAAASAVSTSARTASVAAAATKASAAPNLATACSAIGSPKGLQSWPAAVRGRIIRQFGISNIGGYRGGGGAMDHGTGQALDVMVMSNKAAGDAIAAWALANGSALRVKYVIWYQRIAYPGRAWRGMSNRGGATANHMDHVHISFVSGTGSCPAS